MENPFFITGLPRSGTAWLANLFTTNKSLCFHEPVQDLIAMARSHPGRRVGASDATLARRYGEVTESYPNARWLYVVRPVDDVLAGILAVATAAGVNLDRDKTEQQLQIDAAIGGQIMLDHTRVAAIEFADVISDKDVARSAWKWLLPEITFDEARWKILSGLNVQQDLRLALKERQKENLIVLPPQFNRQF